MFNFKRGIYFVCSVSERSSRKTAQITQCLCNILSFYTGIFFVLMMWICVIYFSQPHRTGHCRVIKYWQLQWFVLDIIGAKQILSIHHITIIYSVTSFNGMNNGFSIHHHSHPRVILPSVPFNSMLVLMQSANGAGRRSKHRCVNSPKKKQYYYT